jgi:predicted transposase/invertase (TIGR01784 family)
LADITNPHDKFFKEVFTRPEIARDFLHNYLPEKVIELLDMSSLSLQKGSFVDQDLRQHFSDLLYRVSLRNGQEAFVYILLEHKSFPEYMVAFQLLRYLVRIWEHELRQDGKKPLTPIVPLVVYHGRVRWLVPLTFGALFEGDEALRPYWPEFAYQLCDLSAYNDDEIKGEVTLRALLLLLKHIFDDRLAEQLPAILSLLRTLATQKTGLEFLETILRYVTQAAEKITERELAQALAEAFTPTGGVTMTTLAEKWIEQGLEQGLEQGQLQATRDNLVQVLRIRFDFVPEVVVTAVTAINDLATLKQLLKQATVAKTLDAFTLELPDSEQE